MAKDDPEIRFRCPRDLKARVEEAARAANRSVNAEIVHTLLAAYPSAAPAERGPETDQQDLQQVRAAIDLALSALERLEPSLPRVRITAPGRPRKPKQKP